MVAPLSRTILPAMGTGFVACAALANTRAADSSTLRAAEHATEDGLVAFMIRSLSIEGIDGGHHQPERGAVRHRLRPDHLVLRAGNELRAVVQAVQRRAGVNDRLQDDRAVLGIESHVRQRAGLADA